MLACTERICEAARARRAMVLAGRKGRGGNSRVEHERRVQMLLTGETPRGDHAYVRLRTWLLRTAVLLALIGYCRGKRCTGLAQKLGRRLLFSHILPINGLCTYGS